MKTLKFGILGCGHIATKMATAVKHLETHHYGIEAYAVASRNMDKAQIFAQEYGFSKAYGNYEDLVSDKNVDLIYVAVPHSHHEEFAKLCINGGKNVLIEKAFCANSQQSSRLIELAHEKGVFLSEAMWTRFLPAVNDIRKWISDGRIGTVESVEADFSMPLTHVERLTNPSLAGGALLDIGIYPLTFADLFLGTNVDGSKNEIAKIESQCIKFMTGVDASDWIDIQYKNGTKAHLKSSMASPTHNEGTIYGTDGFIWVQNTNDFAELRLYDKSGMLVETLTPKRLCNCYEFEVLACKKAIENPGEYRHEIGTSASEITNKISNVNDISPAVWELTEMPHRKTQEMMEVMDSLRNSWDVFYPFEIHPSRIWDRNGNRSILQVYDIETGKLQVLKEFDNVIEAPNWSPDGKFITYNCNGRIYKMDLDFHSGKNEGNQSGSLPLDFGKASPGNITEVPSHYVDNCNNDHVLSPDGSGLYVSHHTKEDGLSRIYRIFFDGREPELITPLGPSYLHGVSPDGNTLAYCAERQGKYDIYTIPAKGGCETRLTCAQGLNDGPEFDSQGKYIWFNSVRTGRMQAYFMKSDGSEQTSITDDPHWNTWFPHISPDLKHVVMVAYSENDVKPGEHVPNKNVELRLASRDPESPNGWGQATTIVRLFGGQGTINVNSWAPDSRHFAFVSYKV